MGDQDKIRPEMLGLLGVSMDAWQATMSNNSSSTRRQRDSRPGRRGIIMLDLEIPVEGSRRAGHLICHVSAASYR